MIGRLLLVSTILLGTACRAPEPDRAVGTTDAGSTTTAAVGFAPSAAVETQPAHRAALDHADAELRRGDHAEAARVFRAALRAAPNDPRALFGLARARMQAGDYAASSDLLQRLGAACRARGAKPPQDLRWLLGTSLIAVGESARGRALLREELAEGRRVAESALTLFDDLVRHEGHVEAVAVLRAARQRVPERTDLAFLEACVYRDLYDLGAAGERFGALVDREPAESRFRMALAETQHWQRDRDGAWQTLAPLLDPESSIDASPVESRARSLAADLREERGGGRHQFTAAELMAIVRGHESDSERIRALRALLGIRAARDRGIEVGFAQSEPILRILAVRAMVAADTSHDALIRSALVDRESRVRASAANVVAAAEARSEWIPSLLAQLESEEDSYAFRSAHEAMRRIRGPLVDLPYDGENSGAGRRTTYLAWRQICQ